MDSISLDKLSEEIEKGIENCHSDLKLVGTLNIKINSFGKLVSRLSDDASSKKYKSRLEYFQNQIKTLSDRRTLQKQEVETEMIESKLRHKKLMEINDNNQEMNEFFTKQSSKVEDYISSALDSVRSLERQDRYINNITSNVREGLVKIGLSGKTIHNLEKIFENERTIFLCALCLLIILILILKFIFK